MSKVDRRWLVCFTLAVLVLTTLPYLLAYQRQGEAWRFGGFLFGIEDGNSYIAKMLRGAAGDWLFRTPYTAFPQGGVLAFLPYLLLGKLTAPPAQHEQLAALFQLFRWLGGWVMAYGTFAFLRQFVADIHIQRAGLVFALLGGGLGWLKVAGAGGLWANRLPLEYYSPESFGFLSLFGIPHLAAARGLLMLGMVFFMSAISSGKLRGAVTAGLLWLLMGFFQPLSVATAWAVLGAAFLLHTTVQLIRRRSGEPTGDFWLRPLLVAGLISAPPLMYTLTASLTDPFMKLWSQQNLITSPPPQDYLLAYLPALLLAVPGLVGLFRKDDRKAVFLLAWLAAFPFLAYAPAAVQRRLPDGIWVVLTAAALAGYEQLRGKIRPVVKYAALTAFLPALILLVQSGFVVWNPGPPLFISADQAAANLYLAGHAPKDSVVLADYGLSNVLPAWAPVRTVTGHGPESVQAAVIKPAVKRFFSTDATDVFRVEFMRQEQAAYILAGPSDQIWQPAHASYLREVFRQGAYHVYQVNLPLP